MVSDTEARPHTDRSASAQECHYFVPVQIVIAVGGRDAKNIRPTPPTTQSRHLTCHPRSAIGSLFARANGPNTNPSQSVNAIPSNKLRQLELGIKEATKFSATIARQQLDSGIRMGNIAPYLPNLAPRFGLGDLKGVVAQVAWDGTGFCPNGWLAWRRG